MDGWKSGRLEGAAAIPPLAGERTSRDAGSAGWQGVRDEEECRGMEAESRAHPRPVTFLRKGLRRYFPVSLSSARKAGGTQDAAIVWLEGRKAGRLEGWERAE